MKETDQSVCFSTLLRVTNVYILLTSSLRLLCQHKHTVTALLYRVTGIEEKPWFRTETFTVQFFPGVEPGPGDTISEFRLTLAALSCSLFPFVKIKQFEIANKWQ